MTAAKNSGITNAMAIDNRLTACPLYRLLVASLDLQGLLNLLPCVVCTSSSSTMVVYSFYIFDRHGMLTFIGRYDLSLSINCCNSRVHLQTTLAPSSSLDHQQIFPASVRSLNPECRGFASGVWRVCADNR